jgi:hypothetical protein
VVPCPPPPTAGDTAKKVLQSVGVGVGIDIGEGKHFGDDSTETNFIMTIDGALSGELYLNRIVS